LRTAPTANAAAGRDGREDLIAEEIVVAINNERSARGVAPLARFSDDGLAQAEANENQRRGQIGHWLTNTNYTGPGISLGLHSEVIYYGNQVTSPLTTWMASTGHRNSILAENADLITVGVNCSSDGKVYAVAHMIASTLEVFSRPQTAKPSQPVVTPEASGTQCLVAPTASPPASPTTPPTTDPTAPPPTPGFRYATAHLESLEAGPNQIRIHGWAWDQDNPSTNTVVHVYAFINGSSTPVALDTPVVKANHPRPDVNRTFGLNGQHGFQRTLDIAPGNHKVCVYSLSVNADGNADGLNRLIACRDVTITGSALPQGVIDSVTSTSAGTQIHGWVYDLDHPTSPIVISVQTDGVVVATVTANQPRTDVNTILNVPGKHGFDATVPTTGAGHTVCVYAADINDSGSATGTQIPLGCRTT
jgi:hypothetical protein